MDNQAPSSSKRPKGAWATLLTKEAVAGTVILAHSLHEQHSKYPLLILYVPTLPDEILTLLSREAALTNAILQPVEPLHPISTEHMSPIAGKFENGWTKLRVFGLTDWAKLVFLDTDMLVRKNMDELFDISLERGQIAATHDCVCSFDGEEWAPPDFTKENCALAGSVHPSALSNPRSVPSLDDGNGKRTHALLNSGLFILEPNKETCEGIMAFIEERKDLLKTFLFPDQDFLTEFFKGRWVSIGWQYNALKTWRYWHPEIWRDDEVKNVHYVLDKPWRKRVDMNGVAGYLGKDGDTHKWWWETFRRWETQRSERDEADILHMVKKYVARPLRRESYEATPFEHPGKDLPGTPLRIRKDILIASLE